MCGGGQYTKYTRCNCYSIQQQLNPQQEVIVLERTIKELLYATPRMCGRVSSAQHTHFHTKLVHVINHRKVMKPCNKYIVRFV